MADVNVTDLTQETYSTLDGTEQVIMFDSAEGKRATVAAVGEYVLKTLTTSLNGSTQTVASALSSLNSDLQLSSDTADMNDLWASNRILFGKYNANGLNTPYTEGLTGTASSGVVIAIPTGANYGQQFAWISGRNTICCRNRSAGSWNAWKVLASV